MTTSTAKKAPAKKAASKAPAKKAAASPNASSTSSTPTPGHLVTWQVPDSPEEGEAVETFVGILVDHNVELGDGEKAARVAVLPDLRVVDRKHLKRL